MMSLELPPGVLVKVLLFAPIVSALAQFGDLFESVLKRSRSRKDSGAFLPGHGGILDRVDGLALSSPIFFFYVTLILERA
jgi:phosphatidate cytidylyltransferase